MDPGDRRVPARPGAVLVGISGWSYPHWRGGFYPPDLPTHDWLRFAADRVDTIEINRSFYSLVGGDVYRAWAGAVPARTMFAVKGSRYITHVKRLGDFATPLANFCASGPLALGRHLGPLLWQLPARFAWDRARVDAFVSSLPTTTLEMARLAGAHDSRVAAPVVEPEVDLPVRHAVEGRHPSFFDGEARAVLAGHGVALAVSHSAHWQWSAEIDVDAELVYARLHGPGDLYASAYTDDALVAWAQRCRAWARSGRSVYVYFDNDGHVLAPLQAERLRSLVIAGEG